MFDDDSGWKREQSSVRPINQTKRFITKKSSKVSPKNKSIKTHKPKETSSLYEYAIDLHGKTLNQSFKFVQETIKNCIKEDIRALLIITGKSNNDKEMSLQQELPRWLDLTEISENILEHKFAPIRHGGNGARLVILRKRKII